MAVPTLTTDLVTIASGESTDSGSWTGGKDPVVFDTAMFIEGSGSTQYICNSTILYDIVYALTAENISSSSVLRIWAIITDSFQADTKTNGGIRVLAGDASNTGYWNYAGKDTYDGGWIQFVLDTGQLASSGTTPDWTAITKLGISLDYILAGKNTPTVWVDAIRYGNLIIATAGTSGDEIDIAGIFTQDDASKYGIVMKNIDNGVYAIRGELVVGDNAGTASTYFKTVGEVIIAEAFDFGATDMLKMTFVGNATGTTSIELFGCFVNAAGDYMTVDVSDTDISSLEFSGNTFGNIYGMSFQSGHIVENNVFDSCYQITPNGSTFSSNTISNSPDTDGAVRWTTDCAIEYCSFIGNTRAIVVPSTITSITLSNITLSSNTLDVYWDGAAGTLTVNVSGGTSSVTTGSAGGTVTVVSGVSLTITAGVSLVGAEIRIYDYNGTGISLGDELAGVESHTSDDYIYSGSYGNVIWIQIMLDGYEEFGQEITMPASAATFTALLITELND